MAAKKTGRDIVQGRKKIRGPFSLQASASQTLKDVFRDDLYNWRELNASQKEALDNMANKMARILTGDPSETESWVDIEGYAVLAQGDAK